MKKVALTGATGNVGQVLRPALLEQSYALRSVGGRRPLQALSDNEEVLSGDLNDPAVVDQVLAGVDVLVHMAGTSIEKPLDEIIDNNLRSLYQIYEGARRHGVKRIIFASSNHAIGMHSVNQPLELGCDFRPDSFYGLSKMWGEGMARLYWDKHGIETVCLRIGSCLARPTEFRHLSTWLSHGDTIHLVERSIEADDIGFLVAWGVSNNSRSYWNNDGAARLGYQPRDNAEDFAAEILNQTNPLDSIAQRFQGGSFSSADYTPAEQRRR